MKIPELVTAFNDEAAYDDDLLLAVESGIIAYLVRGRNAWHSTWVRHYFRRSSLFTDIASAKLAAESLRRQGNVFYVVEVPALLLRGATRGVIVTDHATSNPFSDFEGLDTAPRASKHGSWIDGIYPGVSLRDAVHAFGRDSQHWGRARSSDDIHLGEVESCFVWTDPTGEMQSEYLEG